MRQNLVKIERSLTIRRLLATTLLLLVVNDLRLRSIDADPQSFSNLLCARTNFPTVTGPLGWHITAHRLDCTLFAKRSTTYVYMHGASGSDDPTDLIFRYVGAPPRPSWSDPKHLVLHVDALTAIDLLLTIYAGVHITLDPSFKPSPDPPTPDAP